MAKPTTTSLVLAVLQANPLFSFTMREIIDLIAERGHVVSVNTVASALANLECGVVNVDRSRRPMQYSARDRSAAVSSSGGPPPHVDYRRSLPQ